MPRAVDAAFQAKLDAGQTGDMPWLVVLTTRDGLVERFTNWHRLTVGGDVYLPLFAAGEWALEKLAFRTDGSPSSTGLRFACGDSGLDAGEIKRGRWSDAKVELFMAFPDTAIPPMKLFTGWLDAVSEMPDGKWARFPVRSIAAKMKSQLAISAGPGCRAPVLGGDHPLHPCPFDVVAATLTGTVDSVASRATFTAALSAAAAANHLRHGKVVFSSGELQWLDPPPVVKVQGGSGTTVTLTISHHHGYGIVVGDTFAVQPGCDRTKARCDALGVGASHMAEEAMPGPDFFAQVN